ncbi:MAG: hypothetical protein IT441_10640 [Phycisphaeraceae bacterium]|nr:hypothetical protein [Phycisphaeraceae bacterium]
MLIKLGMLTCWLAGSLTVLVLTLHPKFGALYQSPLTAVGFILIGAGVCLEARKSLVRAAAAPRQND